MFTQYYMQYYIQYSLDSPASSQQTSNRDQQHLKAATKKSIEFPEGHRLLTF
jgi:hypothetical protein